MVVWMERRNDMSLHGLWGKDRTFELNLCITACCTVLVAIVVGKVGNLTNFHKV